MKSPFPGMDPYLEPFWLSFHNRLCTYITDDLNGSALPGDLRAELTERVFIQYPEENRRRLVLPDVYTSQRPYSSAIAGEQEGGLAVVDPVVVRLDNDPVRESFIHITDLAGATLITAIELLSAFNKRPGKDRDAYLAKREEYLDGGVNIVEIDLFRPGLRTVEWLEQRFGETYFVLSQRPHARDKWEVTPLPLRSRLPGVKVPLRKGEPDAVLHLQPLIDRAQVNGRYPIDYAQPLAPPLDAADAGWSRDLLTAAGRT